MAGRLENEIDGVLRDDPYRLERHIYYCKDTFRFIFRCYDDHTVCLRMKGPGFRDVRLANRFSRAVRRRWGDEPDLREDTEEKQEFLRKAAQIVEETERDAAYANSELVLHWADGANAGEIEQIVLVEGCVDRDPSRLSYHVYEKLMSAVRAAGKNCVRLRTRKCGARCQNVKGKTTGHCAAYNVGERATSKAIILSLLDGTIEPEWHLSGVFDASLCTAYLFCGIRSSEGVDEAIYVERLSEVTWAWIDHASRFHQGREFSPAYTADGVVDCGHSCEILGALGVDVTAADMTGWYKEGQRGSSSSVKSGRTNAAQNRDKKTDSEYVMLLSPALKKLWLGDKTDNKQFYGCLLCGRVMRSTDWEGHAATSYHDSLKGQHASGERALLDLSAFEDIARSRREGGGGADASN